MRRKIKKRRGRRRGRRKERAHYTPRPKALTLSQQSIASLRWVAGSESLARVVLHTFHLSTWEAKARSITTNSRTAWAIE